MADSHDEVDDLLRGAMKVLDGDVPSGYFEALPQRTISRLEGNGMHTQSSGIDNVDDTNPVMMQDMSQPRASSEDELDRAPTTTDDSGLHDIRSLASSTKARLSKRFSAPVVDEDVLASSSAGWKAVALPEPAKMISLPELSELPNLAEQPKRSKRESKREMAAAPVAAAPVVADELASRRAEAQAAPATSLSSMPAFGSGMLAKQPSKSKRGLFATAGVGLAAAAGVLIYTQTAGKNAAVEAPAKSAPPAAAEPKVETAAQTATPEPVATGGADPDGAAAAAAPAEPAAAVVVADEKADDRDEGKRASKKITKPTKETLEIDLSKGQKIPPKKVEESKKPAPAAGSGAKEEAVGSLDDLLKEAGVSDKKKTDKPKLEKKSLSGDDIRKGMQSVAAKAQACYAGTQGTASVKLTVAPSGQVQKVTVTGVFAGTPVASCVSSAVQSITFPAWDGGPQSISYSYLLAE